MKLIVSKGNLLRGVNIVSKAVPTRTTMAILECILIDASTNEIKLMANDMELGIETRIEGVVEERGVIALDAKIFSEIVRKLPDSDVTIETDASFKTIISCEKSKFNIVGKSGDDFSYIPYIEKNESIVISQFTLKEVIQQTIFSIADNDNNKLMTGELFEINENELKVVSLDGHRISIRNIELKNNYDHKKVVVKDNGIGLSAQQLKKICNVGVSYSGDKERKEEIESMPLWLRPTAGFGIGLQSIFLVTKEFEIYSKAAGEDAIYAKVTSRRKNGYVQVTKSDKLKHQGTEIHIIVSKKDFDDGVKKEIVR